MSYLIEIPLEFKLNTNHLMTSILVDRMSDDIDSFCVRLTPGQGCSFIPVEKSRYENMPAKTTIKLHRRVMYHMELFAHKRGADPDKLEPIAIREFNGMEVPEWSKGAAGNDFVIRVIDSKVEFHRWSDIRNNHYPASILS